MTTQELIIGHFEKTLSQSEESQLSALLEGSGDARGLLEQHQGIQELMLGEAATLVPSAALDESVIGAALGSLTEVVGGSAGFWTGTKLAAGISALVVGGISVFMIASDGGHEAATKTLNAPTPVVRTLPSADTPALQAPKIETPTPQEVAEPAAPAQEPTAARSTRTERNTATAKTEQQQKFNLPKEPQVEMHSTTRINPDK
jgi:hypothetical protein